MINQVSLSVWFSPLDREVRDTNEQRVLHFFEVWTRDGLGWTACQVARALDLPITSVRPRLTELSKEKRLLELEGDVTDCKYCGKKNQIYRRMEGKA